RQTARIIVERGGDYVLQIKKNQPGVHAHAQTKAAQMKAGGIPHACPNKTGIIFRKVLICNK
ncbi:MAG: hypothetical protein LBM04_08390, partial [Opitutaceae bacterium]|nr:hypothetical protein [Opitutaceae bacterium]